MLEKIDWKKIGNDSVTVALGVGVVYFANQVGAVRDVLSHLGIFAVVLGAAVANAGRMIVGK